MTADDTEKGSSLLRTPGGDQLRERLRQALARFTDPDDDTMPDRTITWVPVDTVLDDLVAAIGQQQFPIASHPYEGFGFEAPCTAKGYGTSCGESEYDHTEKA
ncbi:hypothetical protein [Streptomyces violaceus]|uniref:Uncharacterized protein n=1 Tax=Streptomyces violaceus TaxID=1936 RepID=A0ABY9UE25_STRVL|nr:hypothetical protein [Streptomyces janthinus]WND21136.1 hypothetical protein RI060_29055 [Streptomyces janthinus]GGS47967.1 hypothetical protein GCM10010270_17520 [Streptomyces janthinus]